MNVLKRFEFWLVLACCLVAFAIGLSGCGARDARQREPDARKERTLQEYRVAGEPVFEFEDTLGRRCVYMRSGYSGLLSCGYPRDAAPLRFEDLPGDDPDAERYSAPPRPR